MPTSLAAALVTLATAYVGAGVVVASVFVAVGVGRVDLRAADAGWGFRVLIMPGSVLLWPVVLWRWLQASRGSS